MNIGDLLNVYEVTQKIQTSAQVLSKIVNLDSDEIFKSITTECEFRATNNEDIDVFNLLSAVGIARFIIDRLIKHFQADDVFVNETNVIFHIKFPSGYIINNLIRLENYTNKPAAEEFRRQVIDIYRANLLDSPTKTDPLAFVAQHSSYILNRFDSSGDIRSPKSGLDGQPLSMEPTAKAFADDDPQAVEHLVAMLSSEPFFASALAVDMVHYGDAPSITAAVNPTVGGGLATFGMWVDEALLGDERRDIYIAKISMYIETFGISALDDELMIRKMDTLILQVLNNAPDPHKLHARFVTLVSKALEVLR